MFARIIHTLRGLVPGRRAHHHRRPHLGSGHRPRRGGPMAAATSDDGAVTAETAIVLPAVVLMLSVVLAGGAAAAIQVRCEEAAGAAARVVARGETESAAVREARSIAGDRAAVAVDIRDGRAEAEVILPAPGILGDWGGLELSATASTLTEGVVLDER